MKSTVVDDRNPSFVLHVVRQVSYENVTDHRDSWRGLRIVVAGDDG